MTRNFKSEPVALLGYSFMHYKLIELIVLHTVKTKLNLTVLKSYFTRS